MMIKHIKTFFWLTTALCLLVVTPISAQQQTPLPMYQQHRILLSGLSDIFRREPRSYRQSRRQHRERRYRYRSHSRYDNREVRHRRYTHHNDRPSYSRGYSRRYSRGNSRSHSRSRARRRAPAVRAQRTYKNRYGYKLCETGKYECITVKRGQSWNKLFPDPEQRDLAKRLNRTNMNIWAGMKIAIPPNIEEADLLDIAPMPTTIDATGEKVVIVNLPKLAWAAYSEDGEMVKWGPVSGGQDYCSDIGKSCKTIQGVFSVFHKKGGYCKSKTFPLPRGGAPMPYCMYFHSGFALHGSNEVPGYNASHGCVRLYKEDAQWLNQEFVSTPIDENGTGTQVIVRVDPEPEDLELAKKPDDPNADFEDVRATEPEHHLHEHHPYQDYRPSDNNLGEVVF